MRSLPQPECASHRYDRIKHHGHHWIEEGTFEDFRRNILESDLPVFGIALMGTYVTHIGSNDANFLLGYRGVTFMEEGFVDPHVLERPPVIGLTGTCIPVPYPADRIAEQGVVYIHQDMAKVEQKVLEMLMARPEVVNHEPQAAPPMA
jgi:hypothetical protein